MNTFLLSQVFQVGEQLGNLYGVGVIKRQGVGRYRLHINTLHTQGMLGNVVCGIALASILRL